jgi:hypothetical protein
VSAWEELADHRKPSRRQASLGNAMETFLRKTVQSFAGVRALLHLVEVAPQGCRAGEIARAAECGKAEVAAALERLAAAEVLERRMGLLGAKWIYRRDNPYAMSIYRLRKLWKHPRTHNLVMKLILERDAKGGGG